MKQKASFTRYALREKESWSFIHYARGVTTELKDLPVYGIFDNREVAEKLVSMHKYLYGYLIKKDPRDVIEIVEILVTYEVES